MKLVQFVQQFGVRGVGVVDGDEVVNLTATFAQYETTLSLALEVLLLMLLPMLLLMLLV